MYGKHPWCLSSRKNFAKTQAPFTRPVSPTGSPARAADQTQARNDAYPNVWVVRLFAVIWSMDDPPKNNETHWVHWVTLNAKSVRIGCQNMI